MYGDKFYSSAINAIPFILGASFSQSVVDGIAGDYDFDALSAEVDTNVAAYPVLLYVWAASPHCKKAMKIFEDMGVEMKTIPLDPKSNQVLSVLG